MDHQYRHPRFLLSCWWFWPVHITSRNLLENSLLIIGLHSIHTFLAEPTDFLSDDKVSERVDKSLNERQTEWLNIVLKQKSWKFKKYVNQFTEDV